MARCQRQRRGRPRRGQAAVGVWNRLYIVQMADAERPPGQGRLQPEWRGVPGRQDSPHLRPGLEGAAWNSSRLSCARYVGEQPLNQKACGGSMGFLLMTPLLAVRFGAPDDQKRNWSAVGIESRLLKAPSTELVMNSVTASSLWALGSPSPTFRWRQPCEFGDEASAKLFQR